MTRDDGGAVLWTCVGLVLLWRWIVGAVETLRPLLDAHRDLSLFAPRMTRELGSAALFELGCLVLAVAGIWVLRQRAALARWLFAGATPALPDGSQPITVQELSVLGASALGLWQILRAFELFGTWLSGDIAGSRVAVLEGVGGWPFSITLGVLVLLKRHWIGSWVLRRGRTGDRRPTLADASVGLFGLFLLLWFCGPAVATVAGLLMQGGPVRDFFSRVAGVLLFVHLPFVFGILLFLGPRGRRTAWRGLRSAEAEPAPDTGPVEIPESEVDAGRRVTRDDAGAALWTWSGLILLCGGVGGALLALPPVKVAYADPSALARRSTLGVVSAVLLELGCLLVIVAGAWVLRRREALAHWLFAGAAPAPSEDPHPITGRELWVLGAATLGLWQALYAVELFGEWLPVGGVWGWRASVLVMSYEWPLAAALGLLMLLRRQGIGSSVTRRAQGVSGPQIFAQGSVALFGLFLILLYCRAAVYLLVLALEKSAASSDFLGKFSGSHVLVIPTLVSGMLLYFGLHGRRPAESSAGGEVGVERR